MAFLTVTFFGNVFKIPPHFLKIPHLKNQFFRKSLKGVPLGLFVKIPKDT